MMVSIALVVVGVVVVVVPVLVVLVASYLNSAGDNLYAIMFIVRRDDAILAQGFKLWHQSPQFLPARPPRFYPG
jgi:hypothetical protein